MTDLEKIVSLAKRRGFIFPGSEIYGGLANSWDYGPLGVELKNNIKKLWWERYVHRRDDVYGLDTAVIMNPKVWEASGHIAEFSDPLVECKKCHGRFRKDFLPLDIDGRGEMKCTSCGASGENIFTEPKQFNLMFKTFIGSTEDTAAATYLQPETAQGMFVNFRQILDALHPTLPFGLAQVAKAFRNEITPGNFIFRTRELEIMEIEYFIPAPKTDADWQQPFELWQQEMRTWLELIGIDRSRIHEVEIPDGERAHYSKRTIDFEYDFSFGQKELYGLAYRTDFDLRNHEQHSGKNLKYRDQVTGEELWPHVIEPTWGLGRSVLAVLCEAYHEEGEPFDSGHSTELSRSPQGKRIVLKLKPYLAPYRAAVFPLLANKPPLVERARAIYRELKQHMPVAWDDRGNIGKRYYSQDEIGTPACITVDFKTLEDDTVTIRDRDTAKQERINASELLTYLKINNV